MLTYTPAQLKIQKRTPMFTWRCTVSEETLVLRKLLKNEYSNETLFRCSQVI